MDFPQYNPGFGNHMFFSIFSLSNVVLPYSLLQKFMSCLLTIHPNQLRLNWDLNMPAECVNSLLLEFEKDKIIEI